jgi:hypothetical protein
MVKISELPAAVALTTSDIIPIVQAGVTNKASIQSLINSAALVGPAGATGANGEDGVDGVDSSGGGSVILDRMQDTTTTAGTGAITLAVDPVDNFIPIGGTVGQQATIGILHEDGDEWEIVTGTLVGDSTNLALAQNTFTDTVWTLGDVTLDDNAILAPDSTVTAASIIENGANAAHFIRDSSFTTITGGATFTVSVYAKAGLRDRVRLCIDDQSFTDRVSVWYHLSGAGTVGTISESGTGNVISTAITAADNGFYRCSYTATLDATTTSPIISINVALTDGAAVYSGSNGSIGIYVWGVKFELGSTLTAYAAGPASITRTTVHQSSNGGALVNFSGGTKTVYKTIAGSDANKLIWHDVNIKDYGAVGNGTTDDSQAFADFTADYQDEYVRLTIPPGDYVVGSSSLDLFTGIKKLHVMGYGASTSSTQFQIMGAPLIFPAVTAGNEDAYTALVASASTGATTLTLLDVADASKFTIGTWALLTGFDLQGFGYPPNPHFFEFVRITNISGTTITLDDPLRRSYLSTWPDYGDASGVTDLGGPATLYALEADWDAEITWEGFSFEQAEDEFIQLRCRVAKFINCRFPNGAQPLPSIQQYFLVDGGELGAVDMEPDKTVEWCTIKNVRLERIWQQSSSIMHLHIENCQIGTTTRGLQGTALFTTVKDSWITELWIGPIAYGQAQALYLDSCHIERVNWAETSEAISSATLTDGVLRIPKSDGPMAWAIPGARCMFSGTGAVVIGDSTQSPKQSAWWPPTFIIYTVTEDGTDTIMSTSLPASFPSWSGVAPTLLTCHPMPRLTAINCTGSQFIAAASANPVQGKPFLTYDRRTFRMNSTGSTGTHLLARGYLKKIRVNVTRAYTGAQSTNNCIMSISYIDAAYASQTWTVTINLKVAGERIVTPGVVTGLQSGDSIPVLAEGTWFPDVAAQYRISANQAADDVHEHAIADFEVETHMDVFDTFNTSAS